MIYSLLYEHRDQLIVMDDIDSIFRDTRAVKLLKLLCQTDPIKQVAWNTAATHLTQGNLPRTFQTRSRVALIANDWETLNANVEAVEDRGHLLFFEPTAEEIHHEVAQWFWDEQIFNWIGANWHLIPDLTMREYVKASELKEAQIDWVTALLRRRLPETTALVAKLKGNARYQSEAQRVQAFIQEGGGSRATYFRHAKQLRFRGKKKQFTIGLKHPRPATEAHQAERAA